jgi:hypothetical protein
LQERRVITPEESLLHKKKSLFFSILQKQLPLTLSKKQMANYHSTLATLTQIILLLEMLKI